MKNPQISFETVSSRAALSDKKGVRDGAIRAAMKTERTVKPVKSVLAHFSIGTCYRSMRSSKNRAWPFYGFYAKITHGYMEGEGGNQS
jgi:hypothetical protein